MNMCCWAHSLLWQHSDFHQRGTRPRLLTNRFLKIIPAVSVPPRSSIIRTPTNVPKSGEHAKPLFHFKGILCFLLFFLLFPRSHPDSGWRCQLQMWSGWQHVHTNSSQWHVITYNSPEVWNTATNSTWFIYSLSFVLCLVIAQDLLSAPGICQDFSPKSCQKTKWSFFQ